MPIFTSEVQLRELTSKVLLIAVGVGLALVQFSDVAEAETREVVAEPEYERSGIHNFWFGKNYRALWTTPIQVEVLDLGTEAGGLTPEFEVGGQQTPGLAMKGADGRSYTFRSVNKDHADMLPIEWQKTIVAKEVQDQVSAAHPGVFPILDGLSDALPWAEQMPQRLVVMPDDPRLGEFRERFAGRLGTFGVFPTAANADHAGFLGASEIISTLELWSRWLEDPSNQPDAELLLRYRIVDLWTGNWDRHSKQWRWAMVPGENAWRPIAEDPDQAFVNYQGVLLWLARWQVPVLLDFKDKIPKMEGLVFNGISIDRWMLSELDRESYLRAAREIEAQLTDEVIANAVKQQPQEWYELNGEALIERLIKRRDGLEEAVNRFYLHLADRVGIRGSDQDDLLRIRRFDGGAVEVALELQHGAEEPYFRRRFEPEQTKALHIYLYGGDDRVISEGPSTDKIKVHVAGGEGNDFLDDSASGRTRYYDSEGQNRVVEGHRTKVDTRPYENPSPNESRPWLEPRDHGKWTRPNVVVDWNGDLGLLLGGGFTRTAWSFRKYPHDNTHHLTAAYSTGRTAGTVRYSNDYRLLNSDWSVGLSLRASGIESLNFFGFGNETVRVDELDSADFYQVDENLVRFFPKVIWQPDSNLGAYFGAEFQYTEETSTNTLISEEQPYGSGEFTQFGLIGGISWSALGPESSMSITQFELPNESFEFERRTGARFNLEASYFPETFDLEEDFGAVEGLIAGYLGLGKNERVVLAGRVGGRKVWGRFPWHEAAFIGDRASNRGFPVQRFAGDRSLYGSAELRLHLFDAVALFPGRLWIYGLADVGRVWTDGEESDEWHPSYGAGVVIELAATPIKLRAEIAENKDEGDRRFYFSTGFAF